jgi:hypothetical protein
MVKTRIVYTIAVIIFAIILIVAYKNYKYAKGIRHGENFISKSLFFKGKFPFDIETIQVIIHSDLIYAA